MADMASSAERPGWVSEELFPFRSRFCEIRGCRVHYVDQGAGPVLLMLHGNPTWSFLYRRLISLLESEFRCIAPDYPGFGLSAAPEGYGYTPREHAEVIKAFIEKLDLSDIHIMVQDWGGPIGFHCAAADAARYRGFIIGNTWAWPVSDDMHFRMFSRAFGGRLGRFAIRRFNAFVNLLIPAGTRRAKLTPKEMAHYRRPFPTGDSRLPTHVFPREIVGSSEFLAECEQGLSALFEKPALIVWGDKDPAFREKERRRFEDVFETSRTVILHGAGHFIQEDAPNEIADAIIGRWAELDMG